MINITDIILVIIIITVIFTVNVNVNVMAISLYYYHHNQHHYQDKIPIFVYFSIYSYSVYLFSSDCFVQTHSTQQGDPKQLKVLTRDFT